MESGSIISQFYELHNRLKPYVTGIIYNEIIIGKEPNTIDLFPVGHSVLSFSMDDLPLYFRGEQVISNYNITGQLNRHFKMNVVKGLYKTVMILLKPFGAYRFFQQPQDCFVNRYENLLNVHESFRETEPLLDSTKEPDEMVKVIERWLLSLLDVSDESAKLKSVIALTQHIIADEGKTSLIDLYKDADLSKSTAERYFKEVTGITPKLFDRILRFNNAYKTITNGTYQTWSDIVAEHGYFDQAHFIKEFKTFFGHTPSQLHQSLFNIAGHVKNI